MKNIRKLMYGIITVVGLAAIPGSCVALYNYRDTIELNEDNKATIAYLELRKVADLDHDGKLSDIERVLMNERLDRNCYSPLKWKDISDIFERRLERGESLSWGPYMRTAILRTIEDYKGLRK